MKLNILVLLIILIGFQSCSTISYKKINLVKIDSESYIKRKLNNKKYPYIFIVHTVDSLGNEFGRFKAIKPEINDSVLYSIYIADSSEVLSKYYQGLKIEAKENRSKIKVYKEHREMQLNQLHIFIVDTSCFTLNRPRGINCSEIKEIENIKRFDKRWLWIPIGGPIILFILFFVYGLWRLSKSSYFG